MKLINIVGARPNFMKIAPLMQELQYHKDIDTILLHTGQHYDEKMSDLFFVELGIPKPDINLGVGSGSQAKQVASILDKFDDITDEVKPDAILVVGDVNSTMACSIVAAKKGIKIIHLEAGLRSFDREMPEEINRLITDTLADLLLAPSVDAVENLKNEGVADDKIALVGNIMIDTLFYFMAKVQKNTILSNLSLNAAEYGLITLHRPSNVDNAIILEKILRAIAEISQEIKLVFPIHPRTLKNIELFGLSSIINNKKNLIFTEPLGYLEFQKLMVNSKFVITDSGGVQEETTALKIPCITVRENTERPITVSEGSNIIIGTDTIRLKELATEAINGRWKDSQIPDLWDGKTAQRVIKIIKEKYSKIC
ncbi:MAG TPA: UDP-N-acetylglucosamine 2-epimerase (non-hydrolyzing) [Candidatus Kapabacteria bacterium]|nr:UDP-N-acetylglucosamine 2-epimerase (non-hydrolyzing) [Candidatus Kapabacteria bacterium]